MNLQELLMRKKIYTNDSKPLKLKEMNFEKREEKKSIICDQHFFEYLHSTVNYADEGVMIFHKLYVKILPTNQ